jgi:hypothetical protein
MNRFRSTLKTTLRLLPRTAIMLLLLAAPVLAVPSMQAARHGTIEAPAMKKTGAGLVLLVSLQRD